MKDMMSDVLKTIIEDMKKKSMCEGERKGRKKDGAMISIMIAKKKKDKDDDKESSLMDRLKKLGKE